MLNILFIADVVGSPGRDLVRALLPDLNRRYDLALVVCNGENAAQGFGLTKETAAELFRAGVDVLGGVVAVDVGLLGGVSVVVGVVVGV